MASLLSKLMSALVIISVVAHAASSEGEEKSYITREGGTHVPDSHTLMAGLPSRQLLSTATAAAGVCTGVACGVNSACEVVNGAAKFLSALTLKKAIAAAAANDVIVVRASFNVSSTIKVEKSLRFQASVSGVTIGFTGASPPLITYGVRVFGTSKLKVSFRGLTFDGFGIDRTLVRPLTPSLLAAFTQTRHGEQCTQSV
eukprot:jgi/Mesen1/1892/ME000143S00945